MPGPYQRPDTTIRKAQPNEYFNTETKEYEVVRYYGLYDVQETFLTPDGTILLLAHSEHAAQPWVVGEHMGIRNGVFWRDGAEARRHYAWQIAASFGLTVDKKGSTAVVPASRDYATDLCERIKKHGGEYQTASDEQDKFEMEKAAEALETSASSLAKHLQRIGVLSRDVFESWEVVG